MNEEDIRQLIREELSHLILNDKYIFQKHIQLFDGRDIQTGRTVGTKIGTATDQKVGFFNTAPSAQRSKINDPSGGGTVDSEARLAINNIIDSLEAFGFNASS